MHYIHVVWFMTCFIYSMVSMVIKCLIQDTYFGFLCVVYCDIVILSFVCCVFVFACVMYLVLFGACVLHILCLFLCVV